MRDTQRKLFQFLRACETSRSAFTVSQAAEASGLSEDSVRTYISKKLRGRWVEATDRQFYRVRGLLAISPREFEHAMSQKDDSVFSGIVEWRVRVRQLLQRGVEHGYPVAGIVRDLLSESESSAGSSWSSEGHPSWRSARRRLPPPGTEARSDVFSTS